MNLRSGTRLGPYEIVAPIGAGGMGEVYRARDTRLDRTVAIKVLPSELEKNAKLKIRFQREAKAISALNHPHICTLYDVGESYLVMEYCEGKTLAQRIAEGPMPVDEVVRYGIEMADALEKAHRQGIVHRDLKPSNVMLTNTGVKLLDFGLAKRRAESSSDATTVDLVSEDGVILGTVQYMAPEVLRGAPADARSDIFALGLILYEMLAGKRAFDGTSKAGVIAAILERDPQPLSQINPRVPPALETLVRAYLTKNPDERVQTANDVRRQLQSISQGTAQPITLGVGKPRRRSLMIAAMALTAAAAAGWLAWRQQQVAAPAQIRSLVVLPFDNISKPDDEYFVAGVHDGVIGELSQIGGLRLISRTSSRHYQNANKTVAQIAREMKVDGVVEGSFSKSANTVRLQVALLRALPEETQVWSKTYEGSIDDILSVQKDIAREIATATNVTLTADESARLSKQRRVKPESYEAYIKGMFNIRKLTPDAVTKGLGYLNEAIASDPADPFAYAGLAEAYTTIGHGPSGTPDDFVRAKAAAYKSIELGDTSAEPHAALGAIALYDDWDWAVVEREFKRALELNPNAASVHRDYGWFQLLKGRYDDSTAQMKRAIELDPLTPLYSEDLGWIYFSLGRVDESLRLMRSAVDLDPNFDLGLAVLVLPTSAKGLHDEAISAANRAAAIDPAWKVVVAYALAKAGRTAEAQKIAAEVARNSSPLSDFLLAYVYIALGDNDEALRRLGRAKQARFSWVPWIAYDRALIPLRNDERFQAMVRDLKLPR